MFWIFIFWNLFFFFLCFSGVVVGAVIVQALLYTLGISPRFSRLSAGAEENRTTSLQRCTQRARGRHGHNTELQNLQWPTRPLKREREWERGGERVEREWERERETFSGCVGQSMLVFRTSEGPVGTKGTSCRKLCSSIKWKRLSDSQCRTHLGRWRALHARRGAENAAFHPEPVLSAPPEPPGFKVHRIQNFSPASLIYTELRHTSALDLTGMLIKSRVCTRLQWVLWYSKYRPMLDALHYVQ